MVVLIDRSLRLTTEGQVFKSTKTEQPRKVEFRRQFGPDYRSHLDLIRAAKQLTKSN